MNLSKTLWNTKLEEASFFYLLKTYTTSVYTWNLTREFGICHESVRTKLNWDLANFFSIPYQRNFPISFKSKVVIAKFVWNIQKKVWYYEKWVGQHASFPPRRSVKIGYVLNGTTLKIQHRKWEPKCVMATIYNCPN